MKKSILTAFFGIVLMTVSFISVDTLAATSCAAGKYLSGKTCKACPKGQISAKGATSCTTCAVGTYEQSNTKCTPCPAGSYCVNGIKTACANGYISGASAGSCTYCPAGKYEKNNKTCETCPAGKYCTGGTNQTTCPKGSYCPAGIGSPIACTGNNYTNGTGKSSCSACTASDKAVNATHTACLSCGTKERPNAEHTACVAKCTAGQYVSGKQCKACDAGYYCADGESRKQCASGYISDASASSCTVCAGGKYEKSNKTCEACPEGFYCTGGVKKSCSGKQYCPANSSQPTACPANATCDGKTFKCKAGYEKEGNQCIARCSGGQYYDTTKKACAVCEEGYYCSDGKNRKQCAAGSTSKSGQVSCTVCAAGTYEKSKKTCEACPEGFYCTGGVKKSCNNKQYCPANSSQAIACPSNATCNGKVFTCNKGYEKEGNQCIAKCKVGEYYSSNSCKVCEAGFYCADGKNHKKCADGYISGAGASACTLCAAGSYEKDKTSCEVCPAGKYCTGGKQTNCPAGSSCPAGASQPTACTGNTYSAAGKASCDKKCDAANQIINAKHTGCTTCPAKQEANEDHTVCIAKCEVGQYYSSGKCKDCEAGYYCADGKNRTPCPAGTSNPNTKSRAANACAACTGITYTNATAQSSCSKKCDGKTQIIKADHKGCENCKSGYIPNEGHTACVVKCAEGQWWNAETAKCVACSGNYYCPDGLTRKTCEKGQVPTSDHKSCEIKCDAGYFLNGSKRCEECPAGYYCVDGKKTACPKGQYQDKTRQTTCVACTGNKYTSTTAATKCSVCSADKKATNTTHTACVSCKASEQSNNDHTACVACTKALYNGTCAACKANYPKKQAYACSVNRPICDASTGNCVTCQSDFGSKTGGACPKETPICNKKTGMCEASNVKVACTGNLKWEALQGSDTSCPIGKPICQNGNCVKCTTDKDCLFDIGNGVHHEGARCEANGVCTWAESIACGDANAEVNKKTLKCECKKGYTMQNGKCVQECPSGWTYNDKEDTCSVLCLPKMGVNSDNVFPEGYTRAAICDTKCDFNAMCIGIMKDSKEEFVVASCAAGYLADTSLKKCSKCPEGGRCYAGMAPFMNNCEEGYLLGEDRRSCIPCPEGGVCDGHLTYLRECKMGYLLKGNACVPCPAHGICDRGREYISKCENGYLMSQDRQNCLSCPEAATCDGSDYFRCNEGYIMQNGQCVQQCPDGYYCPKGSSDRYICSTGSYCPGGSEKPRKCLTGYRCPQGSKEPIPCPSGTVATIEHTACVRCTADYGKSVASGAGTCGEDLPVCQNGQCVAYAVGGVATSVTECPAGQYLSNGNCVTCVTPIETCAIAADVINKTTGCVFQKKISCSGNTPVCDTRTGKCTESRGGSSVGAVKCPAGQYLRDGECEECTPGHYCNDNESKPCPAGYYNGKRGSTSRSDCLLCRGAAEGSAACVRRQQRK